MDAELFRVGRLGSEVVLGTQAVSLAGIDILPADVATLLGSFAAGHPDSIAVVGFATELEASLHNILLEIPETGKHLGIENRPGNLVHNGSMPRVGPHFSASGQPALHRC